LSSWRNSQQKNSKRAGLLNIGDKLNKGKGGLAYNIIDIDGKASEDVLDKLRKVNGIIMVKK